MREFDNIMDVDFTDCMEELKRAFREKLNKEIKRRRIDNNNSNKKLNINIQLHMTIEKK